MIVDNDVTYAIFCSIAKKPTLVSGVGEMEEFGRLLGVILLKSIPVVPIIMG